MTLAPSGSKARIAPEGQQLFCPSRPTTCLPLWGTSRNICPKGLWAPEGKKKKGPFRLLCLMRRAHTAPLGAGKASHVVLAPSGQRRGSLFKSRYINALAPKGQRRICINTKQQASINYLCCPFGAPLVYWSIGSCPEGATASWQSQENATRGT